MQLPAWRKRHGRVEPQADHVGKGGVTFQPDRMLASRELDRAVGLPAGGARLPTACHRPGKRPAGLTIDRQLRGAEFRLREADADRVLGGHREIDVILGDHGILPAPRDHRFGIRVGIGPRLGVPAVEGVGRNQEGRRRCRAARLVLRGKGRPRRHGLARFHADEEQNHRQRVLTRLPCASHRPTLVRNRLSPPREPASPKPALSHLFEDSVLSPRAGQRRLQPQRRFADGVLEYQLPRVQRQPCEKAAVAPYLRSPSTGCPRWASCTRIWCFRPVSRRTSSSVARGNLRSVRYRKRASWEPAWCGAQTTIRCCCSSFLSQSTQLASGGSGRPSTSAQ